MALQIRIKNTPSRGKQSIKVLPHRGAAGSQLGHGGLTERRGWQSHWATESYISPMSEFAEPGQPHDGQVLLVIRFQSGPDGYIRVLLVHRQSCRCAVHAEACAAPRSARRTPARRSREDHPGALIRRPTAGAASRASAGDRLSQGLSASGVARFASMPRRPGRLTAYREHEQRNKGYHRDSKEIAVLGSVISL